MALLLLVDEELVVEVLLLLLLLFSDPDGLESVWHKNWLKYLPLKYTKCWLFEKHILIKAGAFHKYGIISAVTSNTPTALPFFNSSIRFFISAGDVLSTAV